MTFILLLTNQVLLPLLFVFWFYQNEPQSRSNFILQTLFTGSLVGFAWIIGPQAWTSIYIGFSVLILFIAAFIKSLTQLPQTWEFKLGDGWKNIVFTVTQILITLVFLPICVWGLTGYSTEKEGVELEFPLQDGLYIVGHGGDSPIINYHNVSKTQAYALDVSKINSAGIRAWGIHPEELDRYAIFGENLYSPCDGQVLDVTKGNPDMNPPQRGEGHPAGNHVVLECNEVEVTMAHFKQNSIVVDSAERVQKGDLLGKVGNSGNTSEPHLHIHAVKDSVGIPIRFKKRFLVRNSLVWN
ncbi:MAG: peptidase M23 [Balneola sp.]|jgi:hypothetical protein|nr:peptidase M23 [Balneola sp.]MBE79334.1 peptidase M23 [Balneola sp.]|tara:strand:+ start:29444 stop:30337 length:894 start_codon:yes stop_codon:yes gene_type:complete